MPTAEVDGATALSLSGLGMCFINGCDMHHIETLVLKVDK